MDFIFSTIATTNTKFIFSHYSKQRSSSETQKRIKVDQYKYLEFNFSIETDRTLVTTHITHIKNYYYNYIL